MRVGFIHGINLAPDEEVAEPWGAELRAAGLPVEATEIRWPSTGSFMGDVASFADPHFKADADEAVVQGVLAFLDRPGVLVTHSMGTVLGLHALRLLALPAPILCMASPLSNPPVRAALRAIGYGRTPVEPVIHLWNADDPICAPGDQPEYFQATRIAVADNEAAEFSTEHAVELYLRHPHTHNALRLLWERGDG